MPKAKKKPEVPQDNGTELQKVLLTELRKLIPKVIGDRASGMISEAVQCEIQELVACSIESIREDKKFMKSLDEAIKKAAMNAVATCMYGETEISQAITDCVVNNIENIELCDLTDAIVERFSKSIARMEIKIDK